MPCPNLEELVIYPSLHARCEYARELVDMSRSRDSRGVKLSSVVTADTRKSMKGVARLKQHVAHAEHRCDDSSMRPTWDYVPDECRFENRDFVGGVTWITCHFTLRYRI